MSPVTILGGGLAGLSCAHHLRQPSTLYEREAEVGGVARSFNRQGFVFDCTGHWLHLRDAHMRALVHELLPGEMLELNRRAEIYTRGVRTPYPFQANTYGLPTHIVADCVLGFFRAREARLRGEVPEPQTFEDYIRREMGDGIAEHFMLPYNTKLWTVPPRAMQAASCGRFVPTPSPEEVVRGALEPHGAGDRLGYNARFLYPRSGGIGRLASALAERLERCELRRSSAVRGLHLGTRELELADGSRHRFGPLVSTLPLPDLVAAIADVPDAVRNAAARLRTVSVTYWDVGCVGANGHDDAHWTYYPDADVPFYRVGAPSAVLPSLAPVGHRSYYVETSHPRGTAPSHDDHHILRGLRAVGLLGPNEEPVLMQRRTIDVAYVLMDEAYERAREAVLAWLRPHRVWSIGRYGAWIYDSMEGALLQGRDAAREIDAP